MPKRPRTIFYLNKPSGSMAKLFWFRNIKPNEMLLGFYGLSGRAAAIRMEFPEQVYSGTWQYAFQFSDANVVDIPVDHFTCHADGQFHVKTKGETPLYQHVEKHAEAIGRNSSRFLDILLMTDVIANYHDIGEPPQRPNPFYTAPLDNAVALNCTFSGGSYPLEAEAAINMSMRASNPIGISIPFGMLKAVIYGEPHPVSDDARRGRPPGTLLVFKWPRGDGRWGAKSFLMG